MRTGKMPYRDLQHTIQMMGKQVAEGVDYADKYLPYNTTPLEIWTILKQNTTYKNDPPGVELLQSMPSLLDDNYWGIPGAGDCDCFTIAALTCAAARGIPARAVIVGNSKNAPTHVYAQLWDGSRWIDFDLVSSVYGVTKPYKFRQTLKMH